MVCLGVCEPNGRLELKMDGEWKGVCTGDGLTKKDIDKYVADWRKHHKVTGARYTWLGRTQEWEV